MRIVPGCLELGLGRWIGDRCAQIVAQLAHDLFFVLARQKDRSLGQEKVELHILSRDYK
jgi:hypothetical protein